MTPKPTLTPIAALNRLNDIATAFCMSQTFFAACNLGVFDQLHQGSSTAAELAAKIGLHPIGCRRLLVALADMGLVARQGDLYKNSELGTYCTSASPIRLGARS